MVAKREKQLIKITSDNWDFVQALQNFLEPYRLNSTCNYSVDNDRVIKALERRNRAKAKTKADSNRHKIFLEELRERTTPDKPGDLLLEIIWAHFGLTFVDLNDHFSTVALEKWDEGYLEVFRELDLQT